MTEPEMVVVRVFGGSALVRWLIGTTETVGYITTASGADAVRAGTEPVAVVGFPRSDVFRAERATLVRDGDHPDWDTLAPRFSAE